jgi:pimeloyl-ACP methyl ester carboxylesterase
MFVDRPKQRKFIRRFIYFFLALLVVWAVAVQTGCMSMRTPDREWSLKLAERGQKLPPQFLEVSAPDGRKIHAAWVGASDTLPLLVMVHGSPGSADANLNYLADTVLTKSVRVASLDRPGFGYTQHFGKPEPSLKKQAAAVYAVAERLAPGQKIFLAGHSLGGPVIARFAMDYPDRTAGLLLIAASIDPQQEKHPWWQAAGDHILIRWLLPKSLYASNHEIRRLEKELDDMMPLWAGIRCPVTVLHAVNDKLVPFENANFAKRMLTKSADLKTIVFQEGDHFILWNQFAAIREAILEMANKR